MDSSSETLPSISFPCLNDSSEAGAEGNSETTNISGSSTQSAASSSLRKRHRAAFDDGKALENDSAIYFYAYGDDDDYKPPAKTSKGAAGYDVYCMEPFAIEPGTIKAIPTNICVRNIPNVWYHVLDRSSMARQGVCVQGGVIDSDYTHEIVIYLRNFTSSVACFDKHSAIAQIVPTLKVDASTC